MRGAKMWDVAKMWGANGSMAGELDACKLKIRMAEGEKEMARQGLKAERKKREAERAGRVRAEAALRKALAASPGQLSGPASADEPDSEGAVQQHEGSLIPMREIGCLQSCYRRRFGTPRQGAVVKEGRAILKIYESHNPKFSTENLEEFSHVWLIYLFHENTNVGRQMRPGASAVKSKVASH